MSEFFKSKRNMALLLTGVILTVTLGAVGAAYFLKGGDLLALSAPISSQSSGNGAEEPEVQAAEAATPPPSEEPEPEPEPVGPPQYNTPSEMRGVFLTPGVDFQAGGASEIAVRGEVDSALESIKGLSMNAVIIDTVYDGQAIYDAGPGSGFDVMGYIVDKSRELGLYTYAVFDIALCRREGTASGDPGIGAGAIDKLCESLGAFAEEYALDGILLDGYQNLQTDDSYSMYLQWGGSTGFENYMRESPQAILRTAARLIRTNARDTQVGLLADPVWANAGEQEGGSNTKAAFTALGTANADTKAFVEEGLVNFVAVKNYASLTDPAAPFGEVVSWWSALSEEKGIPLYVIHASEKASTGEEGWQSHDQLTRQVIESKNNSGYRGSMFHSLSRLAADPKEATTTLIKYYNNEVEAAHILTELEITKPDKTTFNTFETSVTFTGASDPNSKVTINGEEVPTDESGYFTVAFDLEAGLNTFRIEHKEKVLSYAITREVQIIKEISPMGSIATDGGMAITITALAYSDAQVYATVGGQTIPMELDNSVEDEADRDSAYKQFVGEYTTPAATGSEQNIGSIVVNATWEGLSDSAQGASIKVNKRTQIEDGVPVVITADQARTYPPNTLNNIPHAAYYPLPRGAMDYAVGDEIVYKKSGETLTYFVLASGLRVESKDMQPTEEFASGNAISGMTVETDGGYTYVRLKMSQQVAYTFQYASTGVDVKFHYTASVPKGMTLDSNPIFSAASWKDSTLTLSFIRQGGFAGYKGYFDDNGNLVLRFNNPPSSIGSAKIVLDPGHGGSDTGALGFLANYPERVINRAIAQKVADELTSRGATVLLLDTTQGISLAGRVQQAEKWGADMFVSIHNNTAQRSSAIGTEAYYFYPFSKNLAVNAAASVSKKFNTTNRGAKQSFYHVTLSSQFPSVLVECGFMTNKSEYEKLIKSGSQDFIARGIADAVEAGINGARTGSSASGEQSVGGGVSVSENDKDIPTTGSGAADEGNDTQTENPDSGDITLEEDSLILEAGDTVRLTASTSSGGRITWKSGNTSVATVDEDGLVTAHKEGKVKITATLDSGASAVCQIEVEEASGRDGNLDFSGLN